MSNPTVIQALKKYLGTYSDLAKDAPLWVNHLEETPTAYSISPLPGARVVEHFLNDDTQQEFLFAFQSTESTADELARLENIGFYELLGDWFKDQTEKLILPDMGTGREAEEIEALGWGYLYRQGESENGVYQIQCKLTYYQQSRVG